MKNRYILSIWQIYRSWIPCTMLVGVVHYFAVWGVVYRGTADGKEKVCALKKCACSLLRSFLPAAIAVLVRCVRRAVKRLNANVRKPNPEGPFRLLCRRRSQ